MTLKECVANVQLMRSPSPDSATVINYIAQCEQRIKTEIIDNSADGADFVFDKYSQLTPEDTVLLAPDPYGEAYVWYALYMIDSVRNNTVNANNSYSMFTDAWNRLAAYWRRNHTPPADKMHSGIYGI